MDDTLNLNPPAVLRDLLAVTQTLGFGLSSELLTGSLLRTLAASKPAGQLLELGTGTGAGACWLLDGMDAASRLHTLDVDETHVAVAKQFLGHDKRITFYIEDGGVAIQRMKSYGMKFDLIFADAMPGKYTHLDDALALLKAGGLYIIDDLLPQPTWPEDHAPKVPALIAALEARKDLRITKLHWSTGLIIATRIL